MVADTDLTYGADDDDDDDGDEYGETMLAAEFNTCQNCDWTGLTEMGAWKCPRCETQWLGVVFHIPEQHKDAFLLDLAPILAKYVRPGAEVHVTESFEDEFTGHAASEEE